MPFDADAGAITLRRAPAAWCAWVYDCAPTSTRRRARSASWCSPIAFVDRAKGSSCCRTRSTTRRSRSICASTGRRSTHRTRRRASASAPCGGRRHGPRAAPRHVHGGFDGGGDLRRGRRARRSGVARVHRVRSATGVAEIAQVRTSSRAVRRGTIRGRRGRTSSCTQSRPIGSFTTTPRYGSVLVQVGPPSLGAPAPPVGRAAAGSRLDRGRASLRPTERGTRRRRTGSTKGWRAS